MVHLICWVVSFAGAVFYLSCCIHIADYDGCAFIVCLHETMLCYGRGSSTVTIAFVCPYLLCRLWLPVSRAAAATSSYLCDPRRN